MAEKKRRGLLTGEVRVWVAAGEVQHWKWTAAYLR
jgi:hypothetical protein